MIILLGGEKGGTGKSTIATNLAGIRAIKTNRDVLLIDSDPQGSAGYWATIRGEDENNHKITCVNKTGRVDFAINSLKEKFDDIIIDAGGRDSEELRSSALCADKIITPIQPSQLDVWTLDKANALFEFAMSIRSDLRAYILLNKVKAALIRTEVVMAKEVISEFKNLNLVSSMIGDRVIYMRAVRHGMCCLEMSPDDKKANNEMMKLYEEVFND